jgi:hypothetical protein
VTDRTRYDSTGYQELHKYFTSESKCKIKNDKSSHPELAAPHVSFSITLIIEEGILHVSVVLNIDIVDVDYCRFDKKINKANVAIARKQYRQVSKYLHGAFKNKVAHSYELTPAENNAVSQSIRQIVEESELRSII